MRRFLASKLQVLFSIFGWLDARDVAIDDIRYGPQMLRQQLLDTGRGRIVSLLQRGPLTVDDIASQAGAQRQRRTSTDHRDGA